MAGWQGGEEVRQAGSHGLVCHELTPNRMASGTAGPSRRVSSFVSGTIEVA
jgi:hypothetical protein